MNPRGPQVIKIGAPRLVSRQAQPPVDWNQPHRMNEERATRYIQIASGVFFGFILALLLIVAGQPVHPVVCP